MPFETKPYGSSSLQSIYTRELTVVALRSERSKVPFEAQTNILKRLGEGLGALRIEKLTGIGKFP